MKRGPSDNSLSSVGIERLLVADMPYDRDGSRAPAFEPRDFCLLLMLPSLPNKPASKAKADFVLFAASCFSFLSFPLIHPNNALIGDFFFMTLADLLKDSADASRDIDFSSRWSRVFCLDLDVSSNSSIVTASSARICS